jgi:imidazolonepropionase-like amidohydrolase
MARTFARTRTSIRLPGAGQALRLALALLAVGAWATPALAQGPVTALRFKALLDNPGPGYVAIQDAVVVVRGDQVVSVGSGDGAVPAGARVVDLRPLTAIPGMIDSHTHMTYYRDRVLTPRGPAPRGMDSVVIMSARNAMATLQTGVTTVRDLGAGGGADLALRDSINKGVIVGPRMFVAGQGLSKRTNDTVPLARQIQARVDAGADWIKMFGSSGSYQNVTGNQTFTDDEMRIATETAHRLGKPIAIHSYGAPGGRGAMRAGAESVEHPAGLDDATLAEWARNRPNTYYVPTIDHNRFYADNAALLGYSDQQIMALDSFRALNLDTARRAHRAGVKFAMGSDAVYWGFGENTKELAWFVQAGMTPAQALATATTNPAAMMRMSDKLGRIAPGYFADIVGVAGDPLQDVNVLINRVRWVMKGGQVVVDKREPPRAP